MIKNYNRKVRKDFAKDAKKSKKLPKWECRQLGGL